ncbi:hypothetical protein GCM10020256_50450 [Streptomyces thermocoprophilus]
MDLAHPPPDAPSAAPPRSPRSAPASPSAAPSHPPSGAPSSPPDLVFLRPSALPPVPPGILPRTTSPLYNRLHDPRVAAGLLATGALTASRTLLLAGLGWTVHIAADRAFGYGTRRADGAIH